MNDNASPAVSVIVTVYQQPDYLNQALESVAVQTFTDYELIVVDDGSGEEYVRQYRLSPNARLIVHEARRGSAAATRNTGLKAARGKYVAFLDQDDIWLPGKLAAQVDLLEKHPDVALVHCCALDVDESLTPCAKQRRFRACADPVRAFVKRNIIKAPSSVMVRRSALDQCGVFDESIVGAADRDLWFRIARKYPIVGMPEPLLLYRLHPGQLHRQERLTRLGHIRALEKTLAWAEAERPDLARLARRVLSQTLFKIAGTQWSRENNPAEGLKTVRRARAIWPWSLRACLLEFRIGLSLRRQSIRNRKERVH